MPEPEQPEPPLPVATVKKRMHFSPIWLIPILIGLVVAYVGYQAIVRRGDTITLTFLSADGLVPGETPIKHKNVRLGTVEDVRLSDDLSHVNVRVRVERHGARVLTEHARFWVVRPRLSAGNLAGVANGLETLVSGAYIAVDPGLSGGHDQKEFKGLEEPPGVRSDEPGRVFVLRAAKLGSISAGAPVYYRDVNAGEVLKYDVGDPKSPITLNVFIRAPFDRYINDKTHFWNISGLAVNMGPGGLRVELESLQAVLSGGVAFETETGSVGVPVADNTVFPLFVDKASSDAARFDTKIPCVAYFAASIRGLVPGAQVQLLGTTAGRVEAVSLVNDPKRAGAWLARVAFDIQPERIAHSENVTMMTAASLREHPPIVTIDSLSFLTGEKSLALDFAGRTPKTPRTEGEAIVLEGEGGGVDGIAMALGHVAGKLEQIPFDEIGRNLDITLRSVQETVGSKEMQSAVKELSATLTDVHRLVLEADKGLTPALARIPVIADQLQQAISNANHAFGGSGYGSDSDFQRNVERLMKQVAEAARSVRLLADFLDRHPESLLRGRSSQGAEK